MSFADLPNETFDNVIGLLPHSDVNSLSLVSKGFRAAAEPHLYRNLVFYTNRRHLVRWLLLTLLHRPELAAHIKTICFAGTKALLGASEAIPPPGSKRLYEYLEEESTQNLLRKTVLEICGSGLNMAAARISWMGGVLATNHLDGSLAMLACMAVNIESITHESGRDYDDCFEGQYVGFMMNGMNAVLGDVLRMSYVPGPQVRRLGSLKALHVDTKGWINLFVVPSLESIRIAMSYRLQWETIGRNTKLRELEVVRTYVDPAFNLGEPFKNEISPNLARIVYRKLHYRPELAAAPQQLVDLMIVLDLWSSSSVSNRTSFIYLHCRT